MKEVYLVTTDVYADHWVVGAFSSKHIADEFADTPSAQVEKIQLDATPLWCWAIEVAIAKNGNLVKVSKPEIVYYARALNEPFGFRYFNHLGQMVCRIITDEVVCAVNVTNEIRAKILATDLWSQEGAEGRELSKAGEVVRQMLTAN